MLSLTRCIVTTGLWRVKLVLEMEAKIVNIVVLGIISN